MLLAPFGIERFCTDAWGAYLTISGQSSKAVGKANAQMTGRRWKNSHNLCGAFSATTFCNTTS
jgi:hypothetical protein